MNENIDSSIHYLRLLVAIQDKESVAELMHNSFAQMVNKRMEKLFENPAQKSEVIKRRNFGTQLLNRMIIDSSQVIVSLSTPLSYWVEVQEMENNPDKLRELVSNFINNELSGNDTYFNRAERYALLIHQIIANKSELKDLSDKLFNTTVIKIKNAPVLKDDANYLSQESKIKRSWYRYLYAYCNYLMAKDAISQSKDEEAGNYFKEAFEYSPDKFDLTVRAGYYYDMYFLFLNEKPTFQNDYIEYLVQNSADKNIVLNNLFQLSISQPSFKKDLKKYYTENFSEEDSFKTYWNTHVNKELQNAPSFTLQKMNGEDFILKKKTGKWILLDFWGTWCAPCRAEHPDLQKFYESYAKSNPNFEILTIACRDKKEKVTEYMNKMSYNFPVAMSDNKIENIYPVEGYPAKFLITPEGNFVKVNYGVEWVRFIKDFIDE